MNPRSFRLTLFLFLCGAILAPRFALGDDVDYFEPAKYYYIGNMDETAVWTLPNAQLKPTLHKLIDAVNDAGMNDTTSVARSYDSARSSLQLSDAVPGMAGFMYSVYSRDKINVAAINSGSIPGWDSGITWNREHTWPQSRGIENTSSPDGSDLFELRPSSTSINGDRGNMNYGGAYGANGGVAGVVSDSGSYYYPGNLDAGMIAREEFYMAVRYDGVEASTNDLELVNGNPASGGTTMGNLARLIEWNYAVVPDNFERRRNQFIYSSTLNPSYYQHNRDPFVDHPEWVWAVFMGDNNNSQISINGATVGSDGSSTKTVDLGRVFVGGSVPAVQSVTLNKGGLNGTYYEVTTSSLATSTVTGRFNAFKSSQTDSKSFNVGLNTTTSTAGVKSGTVTIDNLDITVGGGAGKGGNDANDTINVTLNVLDHATPSFAGTGPAVTSKTIDFGSVTQGSALSPISYDVFDLAGGAGAGSTAKLDFDSFNLTTSTGDLGLLTTGLSTFSNLLAGTSQTFMAAMSTAAIGSFSATYSLSLSDENLTGAQNGKLLSLTFTGSVTSSLLAGDYNGDHVVDAADYTVWQDSYGASVTAFEGADGNGDMVVNDDDYTVWLNAFNSGQPGAGGGGAAFSATVPEPASMTLLLLGAIFVISIKRIRLAAC